MSQHFRTAFLALLAVVLVLSFAGAAAENLPGEEVALPPAPVKIYTLLELIGKAERIVVGEVGATNAATGCTALQIQQVIKGPELDPKYVDPQTLRRAEALLAGTDPEKLPTPEKPTLQIRAGEGIDLPRQGVRGLFFLWEKNEQGVYLLPHPQCLYEAELQAVVQSAVDQPRSVADGRFLRDWDRRMAGRLRQKQIDRALLSAKAGEPVAGLRLRAWHPVLAIRHDNSFDVTAEFENQLGHEQYVYDGPAGGFAVRLRPREGKPEEGLLLRLSGRELGGVDADVLELVELNDFTAVAGNSGLRRELTFEASEFPQLRKLTGEYAVSVVYTNGRDGAKTDLEASAWTGTLLSDEVPLRFGPAAE